MYWFLYVYIAIRKQKYENNLFVFVILQSDGQIDIYYCNLTFVYMFVSAVVDKKKLVYKRTNRNQR